MGMTHNPGTSPEIAPDQLQALMHKHGVDAQLIKNVFCMVAPNHTNAVSATDLVLTEAFRTGADPLHVATAMSVPNENEK
jgi:hypothetical protein